MLSKQNDSQNKNQSVRLKEVSRERRLRQKEHLRQTILSAAANLFVEKGYEGFSMRQIAERIGYSPTTIYRYYESKDDVLFAIIADGFRQFKHELKTAADKCENPFDKIKAIGRAYIDFGLKNPAYYQLMFMQRADLLVQPFGNDGTETPIQSFTILQQAVEEAQKDNALNFSNSWQDSSVLWALVHGVTSFAINGVPQFSGEELEQTVNTALQIGIKGMR